MNGVSSIPFLASVSTLTLATKPPRDPDDGIAQRDVGVAPSDTDVDPRFIYGQPLNFYELGDAFERFTGRMNAMLDVMQTLRPDIVDGNYDLTHDEGRLQVVDSDLDERSTIWLEETFNGDTELVRLAGLFNDQVVRTFDTERGRRDEAGVFHGIGDGYIDNGFSRNYSGLSQTVGRTTKFMSLFREIEAVDLQLYPRNDRFCLTGKYMEKYIEKDIIEYQQRAAGGLDLIRSIEGPSIFGFWV